MKKFYAFLLLISISCSNTDSIIEESNIIIEEFNLRSNFNIVGHRGGVVNESLVENSLLALNEALIRGYEMAEIDIRFTSDGIPILHHNSSLSDLYSNETTSIRSLTYKEVLDIKISNNGVLPYSLEEFAAASNGDIGFLLDFKGGSYQSAFYQKCIEILKKHNISNVKVAWSKDAKNYFYQKESIKIGLNYSDFLDAYKEDSFSKENYFLIASAYDYNSFIIKKAKSQNVEIVVSVNQWGYKQRGITSTKIIKNDISKKSDLFQVAFFMNKS